MDPIKTMSEWLRTKRSTSQWLSLHWMSAVREVSVCPTHIPVPSTLQLLLGILSDSSSKQTWTEGPNQGACRIPGNTLQGFPQLEMLLVSQSFLTLDYNPLFSVCIQSTYVCKLCWACYGAQREDRIDSRTPGSPGYMLAEPHEPDLILGVRVECVSFQFQGKTTSCQGSKYFGIGSIHICTQVHLSDRS